VFLQAAVPVSATDSVDFLQTAAFGTMAVGLTRSNQTTKSGVKSELSIFAEQVFAMKATGLLSADLVVKMLDLDQHL
jgi:hypothetical protein